MKAWFVFVPEEWGEIVHAETRGKAKAIIMHEFGVEDFTYMSATRVKGLDDKPITYQNCIDAPFNWLDEDGRPLKEIDFYNVCRCEVCNPE